MDSGYVYLLGCNYCPFVYIGSAKDWQKRISFHMRAQGTWRADNHALRNCHHGVRLLAAYFVGDRERAYAIEFNLQTFLEIGVLHEYLDALAFIGHRVV